MNEISSGAWSPHYPADKGLYAKDEKWEDGKLLLDLDTSTLEGSSLVVFSIICCRKQIHWMSYLQFHSLPSFQFPFLPSFLPPSLCLFLSYFSTSDNGKLRSVQNLVFASVTYFSGFGPKGGEVGEINSMKETTPILLFFFAILGIIILTYPGIFI